MTQRNQGKSVGWISNFLTARKADSRNLPFKNKEDRMRKSMQDRLAFAQRVPYDAMRWRVSLRYLYGILESSVG